MDLGGGLGDEAPPASPPRRGCSLPCWSARAGRRRAPPVGRGPAWARRGGAGVRRRSWRRRAGGAAAMGASSTARRKSFPYRAGGRPVPAQQSALLRTIRGREADAEELGLPVDEPAQWSQADCRARN